MWESIVAALIGIVIAVSAGFVAAPFSVQAPSDQIPQKLSYTATTSVSVSATPPIVTVTGTGTTSELSETKKTRPRSAISAASTSPLRVTPVMVTPPKAVVALNSIIQNLEAPPTTTATTSVQEPLSLNDTVRQSLVNIVCTSKSGGAFNPISASGVMIDARGVILTNAHVGQFFLLKDYPTAGFVTCIVRTGSPAYPRYTAELLFLPPSWIQKNAYKITESHPTGNGEHDYALIRITGTVSNALSLPSTFSHLPISTDPPLQGENVFLGGYPAGLLGGITVATNLYAVTADAQIGDVFTFVSNTLDLFSLGGTVVSQEGSSGGPVTNKDGVLLGLIVTATDAPDTASRDLRAISTSYIISDFAKEADVPMATFLASDVDAEARAFAQNTAPALTQTLVGALESTSPPQ